MNCRYTSSAFAATVFLMMAHAATAQNNDKLLAANETPYTSHYKPLPRIAEKDITVHRRVWKEINHSTERGPSNVFYAFDRKVPLSNVLIDGVNEGKFTAYSNENDRFTNALTKEEFATAFGETKVKNTEITGYQIKEDSLWVNTGEVTVMIIGIAPVGRVTGADGTVKEQPLFWIFYPDCREYIASKPVLGTESWYDILENQHFKGNVIKVSGSKSYNTPK